MVTDDGLTCLYVYHSEHSVKQTLHILSVSSGCGTELSRWVQFEVSEIIYHVS